MSPDLLTALVGFAFVTSITPGPNNVMLMASGANFGFRRSVPHMLGVGVGFSVMVALVGVGLMQAFEAVPASHAVLKTVSILYMLYLAWKIATAAPPVTGGAAGAPMSFLQAALFQWVNPKAWAMALTAMAIYAPARDLGAVLLVALVFGAVNLPSVGSWVALGQALRRLLTSRPRLRIFNAVMAALLVASLYPVLAP